MENKKQTNEMTNLIVRVCTDKNGKVVLHYSMPGLLLRTKIIERLITQYSKN